MKFYKCNVCGNIIKFMEDKGIPVECCGSAMVEIIPGEVDAAVEKHVPVVEIEGRNIHVNVGEVEHPMTDAHLIQWIVLETNKGSYERKLSAVDKPHADFVIAEDEEVVAVYEYCNLHGLWKKEL